MSRTRRLVAILIAIAAVASTVVVVLLLSAEEPHCSTAGQSLPWFLRVGAGLAWKLDRTSDGSTAASVIELSVSKVEDGNITFRSTTDGTVRNLTMTVQAAWDSLSTLSAFLLSGEPRIDILSYDARIALFDAAGTSFPALVERASYALLVPEHITTTEQVTELTSLARLYENTTEDISFPGSPYFINTTVQVLSLVNTSALPVRDAVTLHLRVAGNLTTFWFFNTGTPRTAVIGNSLRVEFEASQDSLVASVVDLLQLERQTRICVSTSGWLVDLGNLRFLLAMPFPAGSHRLFLTFAYPPEIAASAGSAPVQSQMSVFQTRESSVVRFPSLGRHAGLW